MFDAVAARRHIHSFPSLSNQEHETAKFIVKCLQEIGISTITEGIGGTGILAEIPGKISSGPTSIFRAELDALPILENATHDHISKNKGIMHACGHDGHMATLLSLAAELQKNPPKNGKIFLLFQPAEETGEGAIAMVTDPREILPPKIDFIFGFHNIPGFPLGQVLLREGTFACASTGVEISFLGKPSHAAYPEHGVSPAIAIAEFLLLVKKIPEMFPGHLAMSTVCHIIAGEEAYGTAAGSGKICLTLRSDSKEVFLEMKNFVVESVEKMGRDFGLETNLKWIEPFEATVNAAVAVGKIRKAAEALGFSVLDLVEPMRWSEDFGIFCEKWEGTGAFFGLGSGESYSQLHNENFDFPDELIGRCTCLYKTLIDDIHS